MYDEDFRTDEEVIQAIEKEFKRHSKSVETEFQKVVKALLELNKGGIHRQSELMKKISEPEKEGADWDEMREYLNQLHHEQMKSIGRVKENWPKNVVIVLGAVLLTLFILYGIIYLSGLEATFYTLKEWGVPR
jgi:hypothetical protein